MRAESSLELPQWLYIGLPVLVFVMPYILNTYFPVMAEFYFEKESGFVENLTVFLLCIAIIYSFRCLAVKVNGLIASKTYSLLRTWLLLFTLGCIYYLGEEISWGQHLFDWATPGTWQEINDQEETNLHNTWGLFDQVPRAIVTLAIVVGGLIIPMVQKYRPTSWDHNNINYWVLPASTLLPVSLTVLIISIHDKLPGLLGFGTPAFVDFNDGEVKESLIALVFMLYIKSLFARLTRLSEA